VTFTIRPISDWTPFGQGTYKSSPFRVTYSDAIQLLDRELDLLDATEVAVELDVDGSQIKNDGLLRASVRPASPAVRLAFQSNQGPLIYATDEFEKPTWRSSGMQASWQHNLYAIALGLEALRKLDRYGITRRGEQYAGWKALPSGRAMPPSHMTRDAAIALFAGLSEIPVEHFNTDPASLQYSWRKARRLTHPDHNDGDQAAWDLVEQAAAALGLS